MYVLGRTLTVDAAANTEHRSLSPVADGEHMIPEPPWVYEREYNRWWKRLWLTLWFAFEQEHTWSYRVQYLLLWR